MLPYTTLHTKNDNNVNMRHELVLGNHNSCTRGMNLFQGNGNCSDHSELLWGGKKSFYTTCRANLEQLWHLYISCCWFRCLINNYAKVRWNPRGSFLLGVIARELPRCIYRVLVHTCSANYCMWHRHGHVTKKVTTSTCCQNPPQPVIKTLQQPQNSLPLQLFRGMGPAMPNDEEMFYSNPGDHA